MEDNDRIIIKILTLLNDLEQEYGKVKMYSFDENNNKLIVKFEDDKVIQRRIEYENNRFIK